MKIPAKPDNLLDMLRVAYAPKGYGFAYLRSTDGEAGSWTTPVRDGQRHMAPPHRLAIELSGQDTWRRLPPTDPLIAKRRSSNHRITAKRFSPIRFIKRSVSSGPGSRKGSERDAADCMIVAGAEMQEKCHFIYRKVSEKFTGSFRPQSTANLTHL